MLGPLSLECVAQVAAPSGPGDCTLPSRHPVEGRLSYSLPPSVARSSAPSCDPPLPCAPSVALGLGCGSCFTELLTRLRPFAAWNYQASSCASRTDLRDRPMLPSSWTCCGHVSTIPSALSLCPRGQGACVSIPAPEPDREDGAGLWTWLTPEVPHWLGWGSSIHQP